MAIILSGRYIWATKGRFQIRARLEFSGKIRVRVCATKGHCQIRLLDLILNETF